MDESKTMIPKIKYEEYLDSPDHQDYSITAADHRLLVKVEELAEMAETPMPEYALAYQAIPHPVYIRPIYEEVDRLAYSSHQLGVFSQAAPVHWTGAGTIEEPYLAMFPQPAPQYWNGAGTNQEPYQLDAGQFHQRAPEPYQSAFAAYQPPIEAAQRARPWETNEAQYSAVAFQPAHQAPSALAHPEQGVAEVKECNRCKKFRALDQFASCNACSEKRTRRPRNPPVRPPAASPPRQVVDPQVQASNVAGRADVDVQGPQDAMKQDGPTMGTRVNASMSSGAGGVGYMTRARETEVKAAAQSPSETARVGHFLRARAGTEPKAAAQNFEMPNQVFHGDHMTRARTEVELNTSALLPQDDEIETSPAETVLGKRSAEVDPPSQLPSVKKPRAGGKRSATKGPSGQKAIQAKSPSSLTARQQVVAEKRQAIEKRKADEDKRKAIDAKNIATAKAYRERVTGHIASWFATMPAHTDLLRCKNQISALPARHATDMMKATYHIQQYALAHRLDKLRQEWKKMDLTKWFKAVNFLDRSSRGFIHLHQDDVVPWAPLLQWFERFWAVTANEVPKHVGSVRIEEGKRKLRLLEDLENTTEAKKNECQGNLIDLCRANNLGSCGSILHEHLVALEKEVERDCRENGCLLNTKFKGQDVETYRQVKSD